MLVLIQTASCLDKCEIEDRARGDLATFLHCDAYDCLHKLSYTTPVGIQFPLAKTVVELTEYHTQLYFLLSQRLLMYFVFDQLKVSVVFVATQVYMWPLT